MIDWNQPIDPLISSFVSTVSSSHDCTHAYARSWRTTANAKFRFERVEGSAIADWLVRLWLFLGAIFTFTISTLRFTGTQYAGNLPVNSVFALDEAGKTLSKSIPLFSTSSLPLSVEFHWICIYLQYLIRNIRFHCRLHHSVPSPQIITGFKTWLIVNRPSPTPRVSTPIWRARTERFSVGLLHRLVLFHWSWPRPHRRWLTNASPLSCPLSIPAGNGMFSR